MVASKNGHTATNGRPPTARTPTTAHEEALLNLTLFRDVLQPLSGGVVRISYGNATDLWQLWKAASDLQLGRVNAQDEALLWQFLDDALHVGAKGRAYSPSLFQLTVGLLERLPDFQLVPPLGRPGALAEAVKWAARAAVCRGLEAYDSVARVIGTNPAFLSS